MSDQQVPGKISKRQQSVLRFVERYKRRKGFAPSIREIGKGVGLSSPSTVYMHLRTLEERGYISRDPSKSRSIGIIDPVDDTSDKYKTKEMKIIESADALDFSHYNIIECPVVSYSGQVQPPEKGITDKVIPLPLSIIGSENAFLMVMNDDGMDGAGILEGDLVIVHPGSNVENGEIAVVISGKEVSIKRVFRYMNAYQLISEKRGTRPVYVKELEFIGKVVGVIRPV